MAAAHAASGDDTPTAASPDITTAGGMEPGAGQARAGTDIEPEAPALVSGPFQRGRYAPSQLQFGDRLANGALQLQARVFGVQQRSAKVLSDSTDFSFVAPGDNVGAALRVSYTGVNTHLVTLGLQAQKSTRVEAQVPVEAVADGRYSGYVQDEWRWSDKLRSTLGMRVDRGSALTQASPHAALVWQAQPTTLLQARYVHLHDAADAAANDAYLVALARMGQPATDGEGIGMLEALVDQRLDGDWLVRAVAYQWSVGAPTSLEAADGEARAAGARTVAHGLEVSADMHWGWGTRMYGSVAMQRVQDADGARAMNAPAWLGQLDLSTSLPYAGLKLGCELRYDVAPRSVDGGGGVGAAVANLRVRSDRLAEGLVVGLSVQDLMDMTAPDGQSGRSVRLEALYRF